MALQLSCSGQSKQKYNGVSFVASGGAVTQEQVDPVLKLNANSAAIMPFGYIKSLDHPEVKYNSDRQWFGETKKGAEQYISMLHKNGVSVMLKPQIWVWKGEFTGKIKMNNEEDWLTLEKSYEKFILDYADLANTSKVELFCIGTELEQFIKHRPAYWEQLIKKVKTVYKGKLTYAANWDEYTRTPFWNLLDYIGIDAYFPLNEDKTPSMAQLKEGWVKHKEAIKSLSEKENKPILFTEYGYRSVDYTGSKPWEVDYSKTSVNLEGQVNATQVILETFWNEDWFAGGYVWKWFTFHDKAGGEHDPRFTPQNKPAEETLRLFYKNH